MAITTNSSIKVNAVFDVTTRLILIFTPHFTG
jgi:hypothetical protein